MTEQTEGAEVEALARLMCEDDHRNCGYEAWDAAPEGIRRYHRDHADTILASDWLAAREAAAEVRGAQAVLAAVEGGQVRRTQAGGYCVATVGDIIAAARAAAAAAGGSA